MKRYSIILVLLICLLTSIFLPQPLPVYADTVNKSVSNTWTAILGTGFTYHGGAADYTVLNDDNDDTSYGRANAYLSPGYCRVAFPFDSFTESHISINSVTLYVKARREGSGGSGNIVFYSYDGTWRLSGGSHTLGLVYSTYSNSWATNPATGLAWTAAQVNSFSFGLQASIDYVRITHMYLVVNYVPPTVPTMSTSDASNPGSDGTSCNITLNGSIDDDGGADITERGFAWGLTSNSTTPGNEVPPASYTANWTEWSSDWGEGSFTYTANLTCCNTYYYRSYALNSEGYAWGDEESFTMMCNPDIDTQSATYVEATTARVNALVVDDGGQNADVRFCYGTTSGNCTNDGTCETYACNATMYDTCTSWVEDTYTTGSTPYVDLSGLTANTTYYVCAQIRNDYSCRCGGEVSFTTESGINEPTEFEGIPTSTTTSLVWVKGIGSTNTLIRYKLGSYPTATDGSDGSSLVYFDDKNSIEHTGLTPGTTYFYMAWGESGGTYSSSNATLMLTTLPMIPGRDDIPVPPTPSSWFSAPSTENLQNITIIYVALDFFADSFSVPIATMAYIFALFACSISGVIIYTTIGNQNLLLTLIVVGVVMGIFMIMRLIPLWHIAPYVVLVVVGIFVGERR